MSWHRAIVVLAAGVVVACGAARGPRAASGSDAHRSVETGAQSAAEATPPSGRRWEDARTIGSPIDFTRLAAAEGAGSLVARALLRDEWGVVAVRALAYTGDAVDVLQPLCTLATSRVRGEVEQAALRSLHQVLSEPPADGEGADAGGVTECAEALARFAAQPSLGSSERDHAQSAARLLSEWNGVLEAGR